MITDPDCVIVGSDAAGSLLAAKLARAGRKVVVLESGPPWKTTDWSARRLEVAEVGRIARPFDRQESDQRRVQRGLRLRRRRRSITIQHGCASTKKISASRPPIGGRSTGRSPTPNCGRTTIRCSVTSVCRVTPPPKVWRPAGEPYPMKPLASGKQADLVARGFAKQNMRIGPMPHVINSTPYNGRPGCIYDGWCDAGCPTGALANPLVTYLPVAKKPARNCVGTASSRHRHQRRRQPRYRGGIIATETALSRRFARKPSFWPPSPSDAALAAQLRIVTPS